MEYRYLGASGFRVPALSFGTGTFGGQGDFFKEWGNTDAADTGRTVPQVALNWLLQRPTVATVIVGARNEEQLRQNLGAVGWSLTPEQVATLDAASAVTPPYPYWHQRPFAYRNPPAV